MNTTTGSTIGIDLAKNVFSLCVLDAQGRVQARLQLRRPKLAEWLGVCARRLMARRFV